MSSRHDRARRDLLSDLLEGQQAGQMGATVSSPRFEGVPERLLGLLDKLIDYEKDFLQTLEGLRAWLLASLAGTTSPQEMDEEFHEGFREFLRTRALKGMTRHPRIEGAMPESMWRNLGQALSLVREVRIRSQASVAQEARIGKSQLSKYENGRELPKFESLEKVLNALGVGPFEFFYTLHIVDSHADDLTGGPLPPAKRSILLSDCCRCSLRTMAIRCSAWLPNSRSPTCCLRF